MTTINSRSAALLTTGLLLVFGCTSTRILSEYDPEKISWVSIDGGDFLVGDTFFGSNDDALPVHRVKVDDFEISRFETSFEQFDAWARENGLPIPMVEEFPRGRIAVADVSWAEALAFCRAKGGRLPSEVEWEYAAAGGELKQLYAGTSDTLSLGLYANFQDTSGGLALPVGSLQPNVFGLYDMSGNVAEWIGDYYQSYPEDGETPILADTSVFDLRIIRGGSKWTDRAALSTYWRTGTLSHVRTPTVGFRCARD